MAVTATVTATKIDITSTGGVQEPFSAIVAAVNAVTAGTITGTGTPADPYTITAASYRELEISSGCKVLLEDDTNIQWQWDNTSGTYVVFELASGSEMEIGANVVMDFGYTGTYHRGYAYWYGKLTAVNTEGNEVLLKNMRSNYFYPRADQTVDYLKIQDCSYAGGYMFHRNYDGYTTEEPSCSYKHITVENTNGNYYGRIYWGQNASVPLDNETFDGWHIEHIDYPLSTTAGNFKIKNTTFKDCKYQTLSYSGGNGTGLPFNTSKAKLLNNKTFQATSVFDNCVFDDTDNNGVPGAGAYGFYTAYGGRTLMKNCTFKNLSYGAYAIQGALVMWTGINTFIDVTTEKRWGNNGTHFLARELDLIVNDEEGVPMENAAISVIQKSTIPKEWHVGLTNSIGKLVNVWGDNPVFIEKEETATGVFEDWTTDGHQLVVSAPGYKTHVVDITFDSNKTVVVGLELEDQPHTVLNESVFNETVFN